MKMNSIIKIGDVFVEKDYGDTGFLILREESLYNGIGFRVVWFDDGLDGLFFEGQLEGYLQSGELVKLSDQDAFLIKLKYSENLHG
jgi:hypothetical protein